MAEQMRPSSPQQAPDPSYNYERSHPEREAGMGRLDNNMNATPTEHPDKMPGAVDNRQDPERQLNAQEVVDAGAAASPVESAKEHQRRMGGPAPVQPDHSMKDEEPDGWDLAPTDIHNPREKRHPRTEGKGGTP